VSCAESEQLAQRFLAATRAADREELLRIFHPDLVWRIPVGAIPPFGGTHRGAERVAGMMLDSLAGTFVPGSIRHRVRLVLSDERHVMMELELRARARDGREYENAYVFVFEVEGGRIREFREHVDTTTAARFFSAP